jgi:hypothetical protein
MNHSQGVLLGTSFEWVKLSPLGLISFSKLMAFFFHPGAHNPGNESWKVVRLEIWWMWTLIYNMGRAKLNWEIECDSCLHFWICTYPTDLQTCEWNKALQLLNWFINCKMENVCVMNANAAHLPFVTLFVKTVHEV